MSDSDVVGASDSNAASTSAPFSLPTSNHALATTSAGIPIPRIPLAVEPSDRTTRSATQKAKPKPKLRLKLSEKAAAAHQASGTSFLGSYDRELDSDDDDLTFEEQFILRLPPGESLDKVRKIAKAREAGGDISFKFKDSRRGIFHIDGTDYVSTLVDLPCIIEAQKTLDNKQMFKVADISQMLVVDGKVKEDSFTKPFKREDYIWNHGITPPLQHVRQRRFRKRVNRLTIETVEGEVERLLEEDSKASQVVYEVLDNVNPDLSDSEFVDREVGDDDIGSPGLGGSDHGIDLDLQGDEEDGEEGDEDDMDAELAAELNKAMEEEAEEDEDEDGDEDDEDEDGSSEGDEESESGEDEEDDEQRQARKRVNEEIRDLEAAINKKNMEIASSSNPLIKRRFEDALKKLRADLESRLSQREQISAALEQKKAGLQDDDEEEDSGDDDDGGLEAQMELDG